MYKNGNKTFTILCCKNSKNHKKRLNDQNLHIINPTLSKYMCVVLPEQYESKKCVKNDPLLTFVCLQKIIKQSYVHKSTQS